MNLKENETIQDLARVVQFEGDGESVEETSALEGEPEADAAGDVDAAAVGESQPAETEDAENTEDSAGV